MNMFLAILGCGVNENRREASYKDLQKTHTYATVYQLELKPPKEYAIGGFERPYT